MKIYIVIERGYYDTDSDRVVGVFSSEAIAEEAKKRLGGYLIDEFDLDSLEHTLVSKEKKTEFYTKFNIKLDEN